MNKRLRISILFICTLMIFLFTKKEEVYAGASFDNGGININKQSFTDGVTHNRTGWLYYLVDRNTNQQVSDTQAYVINRGIKRDNGTKYKASEINLTSAFGVEAKSRTYGTPDWGRPFEGEQGRGKEVKKFLNESITYNLEFMGKKVVNNKKTKKAYEVIIDGWGGDKKEPAKILKAIKYAESWFKGELVLVFEPFFWHRHKRDSAPTDLYFCGTVKTIADFQIKHKISLKQFYDKNGTLIPSSSTPHFTDIKKATGDYMMGFYTNKLFPGSVMFEEGDSIVGISNPGKLKKGVNDVILNKLSNGAMANRVYGYGMGAIWNEQGDINTYNGKDSPGNTEDTTKDKSKQGKTVIYKRYWEKKVDENGETVYNKVKDYKRDNTTHNIIITDEKDKGANYRIIGWFTGKNTKDPQPTEDETQEK